VPGPRRQEFEVAIIVSVGELGFHEANLCGEVYNVSLLVAS